MASRSSGDKRQTPGAMYTTFDPLPTRANKSKARGRKQLKSLPGDAYHSSGMEDAAGRNLKAVLNELATGMPSVLPGLCR